MTSRATSVDLDGLHSLLTESLRAELEAARNRRDEDGRPIPIPPALLAQAIKFLKDNGVDSPARARQVGDVLLPAMPDWSDETHGSA